ncbi:uncharacterized protein LOC134742735 [Cydia strobilella]|uniref:uncharacterized protein LOC134742735 n=1 Tax=Cydia strobilella TaxID=1100964 RepID=UPI0030057284
MKTCVLVFVVCFNLWCASLAAPAAESNVIEYSEQCPPGEYHPGGPGCGLEPTCPPRGFHTATWHASTECQCWCNPGLLRDWDTKLCIPKCY